MMCLFSPPPRPLPRLLYFEHLVPLSSPTYPGYYAALSRRKELFSPADAYRLCLEAILARLTPRAIAALLDHCHQRKPSASPGRAGPASPPISALCRRRPAATAGPMFWTSCSAGARTRCPPPPAEAF